MSPLTIGIIGLAILVVCLFSGMPIAFVFALVGFAGFSYLVSLEAAFNLVAIDIFDILSGYTLTVIPMFMLMGSIAFYSGASSRLYDAAYKFFGRLPGGLAVATFFACGAFGAVCGSGNAGAAAMGKVALPEMRKHNYDTSLASACIAAGGPLSALIPPSAVLIIYAVIVGESVSRLFMAGILPGVLKTIMFALTVFLLCWWKPSLGPAGGASTLKAKLKSLGGVSEMAALFILVIGGLFIGVFTPTEAGAIGAGGALIIALVRRELTWQGFTSALADTVKLTTMLFIIVACAMIFGHFLVVANINLALQSWLLGLNVSPIIVMWLISLIFIIGGCFIDVLALILLTVPIFFPVVIVLGFDPYWFGILVVLLGNIGCITPPVGMEVYVIHGVAPDIPIETIFRGIVPFFIADIIGVIIIMYLPQIATFLPHMMQ